MSAPREDHLSKWERHLPAKIVRGPFEWSLVWLDGMAAYRDSGMDAVCAAYRGTFGTVLRPFAMTDHDETALGKAAQEEADKAWEFYKSVSVLISDYEKGKR